MPGSQSSIDARHALRAAIVMTAARLAPGNGTPSLRHLALIAESHPISPPATWTDATALTLATQFAARGLQDVLSLGPELVGEYFDGVQLRRPASLSAGVRAQLYACVAEYCNGLGWTHVAARFGVEAQLFADSPGLLYRALTVSAVAESMNGEFAAADDAIRRAQELFVSQGWPPTERACAHFMAELVVASSRADEDHLRQISRQMTAARPDDPYWGFAADLAEVMARGFGRDFTGALALSAELLFGARRYSSFRTCRYYLVCLRADMLVARGEYEQALALLEGYESPPGHGVCFASQRSASLLHLGREQEVIAATEECAANEADHNLRTLVPLLARRALAFQRVGDARRAARTMESVLLLTGRTGRSLLPFVMLPLDEVSAVLDATAASRPALRSAVDEIVAALPRVTAPAPETPASPTFARLTTAERDLTEMLPTPLSLAAIAAVRGVSVNTVKSQARSIYVKLGVRSRIEAMDLLAAPYASGNPD